MSQQVLLEEREVTYTPAEKLGAALKIRAELSKSVRPLWASREGIILRTELSKAAEASGFAGEMERIMKQHADEIKAIAERTIKQAYKAVWGKR